MRTEVFLISPDWKATSRPLYYLHYFGSYCEFWHDYKIVYADVIKISRSFKKWLSYLNSLKVLIKVQIFDASQQANMQGKSLE